MTARSSDQHVPTCPRSATDTEREDKRHSGREGFTLVELSIALIIIGLLVGAVLQGRDMIARARLDATVTQIEAIATAFDGFRDRYGALPGDYAQAVLSFGAGVDNGDGNGTIDGTGASGESLAAWLHLIRAGLLGERRRCRRRWHRQVPGNACWWRLQHPQRRGAWHDPTVAATGKPHRRSGLRQHQRPVFAR